MNRLVSSLAGLVLAVSAQAAIQITYSIDGGATTTCNVASSDGPVVCPSILGPTLGISLLEADSNSPGANPTFEESAVLHINNVTGGTHSIAINVAAQDFTTPTAPPNILVNSHIGGTVVIGSAANTLSMQSCLDAGDTLNGCPGTFQTAVGTPSITAPGSFKNDQLGTVTSIAGPYAIDELINLTLGGGAQVNFAASTTLTQVPEPTSIVLLGGALLLASGRLIRRKKNQQA